VHTEEGRGKKRKVGKKNENGNERLTTFEKVLRTQNKKQGAFFWILKRGAPGVRPFKQDACIYVPTLHDNS